MTNRKKTTVTGTKAPPAAIPKPGAAAPVATAEPINLIARQLKIWDQAVQLFTKRQFAEACEGFREAAKGPAAHIADKARSYLQICERKIAKRDIEFHTAEDHFNYGVERLNARDIDIARFHFGRALGLEPDADYILYTMALCCGLAGDGNAACENLKRAIDIEPRNRILARQDPEFSALAAQLPALRALLSTDATGSL
jgi:tetratricopeptide (TPR) repeat protein